MPKLRISGTLQYLLWFLGRNEKNKCGGVPKWLYIVGNLKKKSGLFKKDQVKSEKKKIWKKNMVLNKSKKRKKWRKKKSRNAIWALLCKVSGIDDIWKEKNCAPLVFRKYFVPYIYLFFIVKPLTLVAPLQPC